MAWGTKGIGGPFLSILRTIYRHKVLVTLKRVQVVFILKCHVAIDEGSFSLSIFSKDSPFPYLIYFSQ
jgi:hypothetical protein